MNASSKYILNVLKSWEEKFPGIHIKYAYEEATCFHVIEVEPEEIHEGSEAFAIEETKLWESFFEMFPEEDILITSPSPCNDMSNLIHETGAIVESFKNTVNESFSNKIFAYPDIKFDDIDIEGLFSELEANYVSGKKYNYSYKARHSYSFENENEYALAA